MYETKEARARRMQQVARELAASQLDEIEQGAIFERLFPEEVAEAREIGQRALEEFRICYETANAMGVPLKTLLPALSEPSKRNRD